jgi:hypothetical protein
MQKHAISGMETHESVYATPRVTGLVANSTGTRLEFPVCYCWLNLGVYCATFGSQRIGYYSPR